MKASIDGILNALVWFASRLKSRKVRTAIATVIAAFVADSGFEADESLIVTILGVGVAVILGTALEDFGIKRRSSVLDRSAQQAMQSTAGTAVAHGGNGSSEAERN